MKLLILVYLTLVSYVAITYYNSKIVETNYNLVCMVLSDGILKPVVSNEGVNIIVTHYNISNEDKNKITTYRRDVSILTEFCLYLIVLVTIGAFGFIFTYREIRD